MNIIEFLFYISLILTLTILAISITYIQYSSNNNERIKIKRALDAISYVKDVIADMHIIFLDSRIEVFTGETEKTLTIKDDANNVEIILISYVNDDAEIIITDSDGVRNIDINTEETMEKFTTLYSMILKLMMINTNI